MLRQRWVGPDQAGVWVRAVYARGAQDPPDGPLRTGASGPDGPRSRARRLLLVGPHLPTPVLAADPVPHPPGAIARFSWLMAAMTVMSIPAGLFIFDEHVRYPFYLAPASALHSSALADQHAAGMIMLFAGGVAMAVLAILVAMEAMILEERRQLRRDPTCTRTVRRRPTRPAASPGSGGRMRRGMLHSRRSFAAACRCSTSAHTQNVRDTPVPLRAHPVPPRSLVGRAMNCFSPPARRVTA